MKVNIPLNHTTLTLIAEIDEFKGAWAAYQKISPDTLALMRHVATIASVGSSTRIEGVKLSDAEIEALLAGLSTESFASRDEEEVAGYAEAVNLVFDAYKTIPLNENYICQLHQILLKFSSKDVRHRGNYKKHPNHVEAFDEDGRSLGVIFETASAFDTPLKMRELVEWLQTTLDKKWLHPLLAIAAFVVMFLAIHPFQDGNGRLSRVLTLLLLLKAGYHYVPYSSLEQIIENNKEAYYRALRLTQKTLANEQPDWLPWLSFFLQTLSKQKQRLEARLKQEQRLVKQALSTLEEQMMAIINNRGKATIGELVILTSSSRNTLKSSLKKLVNLQLIELHGKGRGAFYSQTVEY
jgi:Fic family protein